MKTFLKSLPLFFSILLFEFIVYFFIFFCFGTDFTTIRFLYDYPLVLRIPVSVALLAGFIACFLTEDSRYFFLAITANMVFLFVFFEMSVFHTIPAFPVLFRLAGRFFISLWENVKDFFDGVFLRPS